MQKAPLLVTVLALILGTGCLQPQVANPEAAESPTEESPATERAVISWSQARVSAELATDPASRERGLMFRKELSDGEGMLFIYPERRILSFWMRNTVLPLSIAFIEDDGTIVNIEKMKPLDTGPRYQSDRPVRFALEVPQGWFERNGIRPGDRAEIRLPKGIKVR